MKAVISLFFLSLLSVVHAISVENLDIGDVFEKEHYEAVVEIRNDTDAPVVLERVTPSCGCIRAVGLELPVLLKPDGLLQLPLQLDTRGKRGNIEERIILQWKDKDGSISSRLTSVVGKVRPLMRFIPDVNHVGPYKLGDSVEEAVRIEIAPPFHLKAKFSTEGDVRLSKTETVRQYTVLKFFPKVDEPGMFQGRIVVDTENGRITKQLAWSVRHSLSRTDMITCGFIPQNEPYSFSVSIVSPGEGMKIVNSKVMGSDAGIEMESLKLEGDRVDISYLLTPLKQGRFSGLLAITVMQGDVVDRVVVPISYIAY